MYARIDQLDDSSEPNEDAIDNELFDDGDPNFEDIEDEEPAPEPAKPAYKCSNCQYETDQHASYLRHTSSFVECESCPIKFCGKYSGRRMVKHQKQSHPMPKNVCKTCGKSFKYPSYLKRHAETTSCAWK